MTSGSNASAPHGDEEMLIAGTVRGRVGYAFGNWLPYATGGFAWIFDRVAFNDTEGTIIGRVVRPATFDPGAYVGWAAMLCRKA